MATRKPAEKPKPEVVEAEREQSKVVAVDIPEKATALEPKPPVKVPSIMGSTFAERAAANKAVGEKRTESKG